MKNSTLWSKLRSPEGFTTGTGATITLATLLAIYSLSMVTSLPGLAVSPILAQLQQAFPHASQLEIQMLESLPSLIIIPIILLAGRLSVNFDRRRLIIIGLTIFVVSAIIYLLPIGIGMMLFNSVLLGVGAGMVIPLSTGMIAYYFTGERRTKQLGIASAISNLTLVLATALTGYLAGIEWRMSFLVYALAVVSLVLAFRIPKNTNPVVVAQAQVIADYPKQSYFGGRVQTDWPVGLMIFYFLMTMAALAVPFNLSVFMEHYHIGSADISGTLISVFFLSITLPGFFINKLISGAKARNNLLWIGAVIVGALIFLIPSQLSAIVAVIFMGLGYGVMQPLIYDRTSERAAKHRTTFHLALVMSMNYFAIILYPFIQRVAEYLFMSHSPLLPFIMSVVFAVGYWAYDFRKIMLNKRAK